MASSITNNSILSHFSNNFFMMLSGDTIELVLIKKLQRKVFKKMNLYLKYVFLLSWEKGIAVYILNTLAYMVFAVFLICLALCLQNSAFLDSFPALILAFGILAGFSVVITEFLMHALAKLFLSLRFLSWLGHILCLNRNKSLLLLLFSGFGFLVLLFFSLQSNAVKLVKFSPKVLVLGLDGATWDIINPGIKDNKLKNFSQLCQTGVYGNLRSIDPMYSPSLWTSIATGVSPEKHGVSGFFSTQADLKIPRVWDYAEKNKLKTGLFSWIVTWPPSRQFEFVMPSWFAPRPDTWPPEYSPFQELLLEQSMDGSQLNPWMNVLKCIRLGARYSSVCEMLRFNLAEWGGLNEEQHLLRRAMAMVPLQTDLFLSLMKTSKPDVAAFVLYGSDELGHRFFHDMKPALFPDQNGNHSRKEFQTAITDYYQAADASFGRILATLPPDTYVIVVSDHGMKADDSMPRQFFLDIPNFLNVLNLRNDVYYQRIMRHVLLEPKNLDDLALQALIDKIQSIHFEGEPEPVFSVEKDEKRRLIIQTAFSLSWHEASPLLTKKHIVFGDKTMPVEKLFFLRTFSGEHDNDGIFILSGPGIKSAEKVVGTSILDIAPTMMYLLHLPIPKYMEGKIVSTAFEPGFMETHPAEWSDEKSILNKPEEKKADDTRALMERLRSLGYIK